MASPSKAHAVLFYAFVIVTTVASQKLGSPMGSPIDNDLLISMVNREFAGRVDGWTASRTKFYSKSLAEKQSHLGFKQAPLPTVDSALRNQLVSKPGSRGKRAVFPPTFDARLQWPACSARLGDIRDQGNCGSCWGTAVASVFSDRFCIFKSQPSVKISVQDQINCMPASYIPSTWSTDLCNGFDTLRALRMAVNYGIVTGGEYNETSGCEPYSYQTFVNGKGGLSCKGVCSNTLYNTSFSGDKQKGITILLMGNNLQNSGLNKYRSYNLDANLNVVSGNTVFATVEQVIMDEIMTRGSVTTSFDVYNDFFYYTSGVYRMTRAKGNYYAGGHAVKIIGWGTVGTTPYWICVNSWGTSFGENGTFRILRGVNHVKIESYLNSVTV